MRFISSYLKYSLFLCLLSVFLFTGCSQKSYDVDYDTFKEFVQQIFKKRKLVIPTSTIDVDNDSSMTPDYINFNKSKKPVPEKPKKNQEGLIPEEEY